jgi:hypothetical protein
VEEPDREQESGLAAPAEERDLEQVRGWPGLLEQAVGPDLGLESVWPVQPVLAEEHVRELESVRLVLVVEHLRGLQRIDTMRQAETISVVSLACRPTKGLHMPVRRELVLEQCRAHLLCLLGKETWMSTMEKQRGPKADKSVASPRLVLKGTL